METTYNHYALADPRIDDPILRVRYIGRTVGSLEGRFYLHLWRARRGGETHRERWIRTVLADHLEPIVIDLGDGNEERESELIVYWRSLGCDLTNTTAGGDGLVGVVLSPETREHKRQILQALRSNPEIRAKLYSPENQKKRGESFRRVHSTPELWDKCKAARLASRQKDPERWKQAMLEARNNPAHIEKRLTACSNCWKARRAANPLSRQIIAMAKEGINKAEVARRLGVSYKLVCHRVIALKKDGLI